MPLYFYTPGAENGWLSNFSRHGFSLDGRYWPTAEHYFQAQKFADPAHVAHIASAPTPKEAANRGRDRSVPLRADWDQVRDEVMARAVHAKFQANQELRELLLATGNEELVENGP